MTDLYLSIAVASAAALGCHLMRRANRAAARREREKMTRESRNHIAWLRSYEHRKGTDL